MNIKQVAFIGGTTLQILVLGITLHYVHDFNHKKETYRLEVLDDEDSFIGFQDPYTPPERGFDIPFKHYVLGQGRVVPSSDYVHVDASVSGKVENVFVRPGDYIEEGDLLFQLNDSQLRCSLRGKMAELDTAVAQLDQIKQAPSPYELAAKEKELATAQIQYDQQQKDCQIFDSLLLKSAVSTFEREEQETQLKITANQMERVLCELEELRQGPTEADIRVYQSRTEEKAAQVASVEKQLKDCRVVAPISGRVMSVKLNPGEYIDPNAHKGVVIGSDSPLHLVVQIPEKDAWRISPKKSLKAIAVHKTNPKIHFILDYVSVQPCLQDDGKLEVVFAFDKGKAPIYLEQNLDVFIDAASPADTACLEYQFNQTR